MTLHEAAADLGVHYMTAYRYVRLGQLPAVKAGGTWQVRRADLESFRSGAEADASDEAPKGRTRRAPWAQRLEQRLLAGDTSGAWGVMEAAMTAGASIEDCYLEVLAPAMHSIGSRWERGEIDVAVEHLATSIAGRLIGRLGARTFRRGRSRGTVLLGAVAGERHSLPVAVLADLVRLAGWEIVDLGADVPVASFVHAAETVGTELVAIGLSATAPDSLGAMAATVTALRGVLDEQVLVAVGGLAIRDLDHAQELGAQAYASDARTFVALLDQYRPGKHVVV